MDRILIGKNDAGDEPKSGLWVSKPGVNVISYSANGYLAGTDPGSDGLRDGKVLPIYGFNENFSSMGSNTFHYNFVSNPAVNSYRVPLNNDPHVYTTSNGTIRFVENTESTYAGAYSIFHKTLNAVPYGVGWAAPGGSETFGWIHKDMRVDEAFTGNDYPILEMRIRKPPRADGTHWKPSDYNTISQEFNNIYFHTSNSTMDSSDPQNWSAYPYNVGNRLLINQSWDRVLGTQGEWATIEYNLEAEKTTIANSSGTFILDFPSYAHSNNWIANTKIDLIRFDFDPSYHEFPDADIELDYIRVKKRGIPINFGNSLDSNFSFSSDWFNTGLIHQTGTVTIGTEYAYANGYSKPSGTSHPGSQDGRVVFPKLPYIPVVLFQRYDDSDPNLKMAFPAGDKEFSTAHCDISSDAQVWNPLTKTYEATTNTSYGSEFRTFAYSRAGYDHFDLTCRNAIARDGYEWLFNYTPQEPYVEIYKGGNYDPESENPESFVMYPQVKQKDKFKTDDADIPMFDSAWQGVENTGVIPASQGYVNDGSLYFQQDRASFSETNPPDKKVFGASSWWKNRFGEGQDDEGNVPFRMPLPDQPYYPNEGTDETNPTWSDDSGYGNWDSGQYSPGYVRGGTGFAAGRMKDGTLGVRRGNIITDDTIPTDGWDYTTGNGYTFEGVTKASLESGGKIGIEAYTTNSGALDASSRDYMDGKLGYFANYTGTDQGNCLPTFDWANKMGDWNVPQFNNFYQYDPDIGAGSYTPFKDAIGTSWTEKNTKFLDDSMWLGYANNRFEYKGDIWHPQAPTKTYDELSGVFGFGSSIKSQGDWAHFSGVGTNANNGTNQRTESDWRAFPQDSYTGIQFITRYDAPPLTDGPSDFNYRGPAGSNFNYRNIGNNAFGYYTDVYTFTAGPITYYRPKHKLQNWNVPFHPDVLFRNRYGYRPGVHVSYPQYNFGKDRNYSDERWESIPGYGGSGNLDFNNKNIYTTNLDSYSAASRDYAHEIGFAGPGSALNYASPHDYGRTGAVAPSYSIKGNNNEAVFGSKYISEMTMVDAIPPTIYWRGLGSENLQDRTGASPFDYDTPWFGGGPVSDSTVVPAGYWDWYQDNAWNLNPVSYWYDYDVENNRYFEDYSSPQEVMERNYATTIVGGTGRRFPNSESRLGRTTNNPLYPLQTFSDYMGYITVDGLNGEFGSSYGYQGQLPDDGGDPYEFVTYEFYRYGQNLQMTPSWTEPQTGYNGHKDSFVVSRWYTYPGATFSYDISNFSGPAHYDAWYKNDQTDEVNDYKRRDYPQLYTGGWGNYGYFPTQEQLDVGKGATRLFQYSDEDNDGVSQTNGLDRRIINYGSYPRLDDPTNAYVSDHVGPFSLGVTTIQFGVESPEVFYRPPIWNSVGTQHTEVDGFFPNRNKFVVKPQIVAGAENPGAAGFKWKVHTFFNPNSNHEDKFVHETFGIPNDIAGDYYVASKRHNERGAHPDVDESTNHLDAMFEFYIAGQDGLFALWGSATGLSGESILANNYLDGYFSRIHRKEYSFAIGEESSDPDFFHTYYDPTVNNQIWRVGPDEVMGEDNPYPDYRLNEYLYSKGIDVDALSPGEAIPIQADPYFAGMAFEGTDPVTGAFNAHRFEFIIKKTKSHINHFRQSYEYNLPGRSPHRADTLRPIGYGLISNHYGFDYFNCPPPAAHSYFDGAQLSGGVNSKRYSDSSLNPAISSNTSYNTGFVEFSGTYQRGSDAIKNANFDGHHVSTYRKISPSKYQNKVYWDTTFDPSLTRIERDGISDTGGLFEFITELAGVTVKNIPASTSISRHGRDSIVDGIIGAVEVSNTYNADYKAKYGSLGASLSDWITSGTPSDGFESNLTPKNTYFAFGDGDPGSGKVLKYRPAKSQGASPETQMYGAYLGTPWNRFTDTEKFATGLGTAYHSTGNHWEDDVLPGMCKADNALTHWGTVDLSKFNHNHIGYRWHNDAWHDNDESGLARSIIWAPSNSNTFFTEIAPGQQRQGLGKDYNSYFLSGSDGVGVDYDLDAWASSAGYTRAERYRITTHQKGGTYDGFSLHERPEFQPVSGDGRYFGGVGGVDNWGGTSYNTWGPGACVTPTVWDLKWGSIQHPVGVSPSETQNPNTFYGSTSIENQTSYIGGAPNQRVLLDDHGTEYDAAHAGKGTRGGTPKNYDWAIGGPQIQSNYWDRTLKFKNLEFRAGKNADGSDRMAAHANNGIQAPVSLKVKGCWNQTVDDVVGGSTLAGFWVVEDNGVPQSVLEDWIANPEKFWKVGDQVIIANADEAGLDISDTPVTMQAHNTVTQKWTHMGTGGSAGTGAGVVHSEGNTSDFAHIFRTTPILKKDGTPHSGFIEIHDASGPGIENSPQLVAYNKTLAEDPTRHPTGAFKANTTYHFQYLYDETKINPPKYKYWVLRIPAGLDGYNGETAL